MTKNIYLTDTIEGMTIDMANTQDVTILFHNLYYLFCY